MSQQGERPTGHEDDWWGQLYDDSTEDTGPTAVADSLDDRFASAAGTVGQVPAAPPEPSPSGTTPPPDRRPRSGAYGQSASSNQSAPSNQFGSPDQSGNQGVPYNRLTPPDISAPGDGQRSADRPRRPGDLVHRPVPWETPPAGPPGPAPFPPGPKPPGFRAEAPEDGRAPTDAPVAPAPVSRTPAGAPSVSAAGNGASKDTGKDAGKAAPPPHDTAPPANAPGHVTLRPRDATFVTGSEPTAVAYVGSGPPTYDAEPTALPPADPDALGDLVADTVLDGAQYGACTLRAASVRGDSARYRGEPRRDSLLTARFGSGEEALVLVAMATGARATPGAHRAAAEACEWIGRAVGRSHVRLAEDLRAARRGDLKSGLHRLTDRSLGKLRASAAEQGVEPGEYTASLRCLLLPADPQCRTRVFFGVGVGGLFRMRDGEWQDIEPRVSATTGAPVVGFGSLPDEAPRGDRLTMDLGIATPPSPYEPAPAPSTDPFRFRASVARPGDALLLCTAGLADPLRGEPQLAEHLTARWATGEPPGLAAFLADTQVRVKGYADDRTAAAVWEG